MRWQRSFFLLLLSLVTAQSHAADLLGPEGTATVTLADLQLNSSSWAAANLLDDDVATLWLTTRRDNDLIFELECQWYGTVFRHFYAAELWR